MAENNTNDDKNEKPSGSSGVGKLNDSVVTVDELFHMLNEPQTAGGGGTGAGKSNNPPTQQPGGNQSSTP